MAVQNEVTLYKKRSIWSRYKRDVLMNYQLYIIILLPLIWLFIFRYIPMYGVQIAFKNFQASKGILGSEWVGLYQFKKFFNNYMFEKIITNTITLSLYQMIAGFPFPIILALALNNTLYPRFKKTVQMVTYMPHFISTVVMVGIILQLVHPRIGLINNAIKALGGTPIDFMAKAKYFPSIYVWSGVWQSTGWGTIIYLAALAGIDPELHEAAVIDGASRLQRVKYVDLPGILPTIVVILILNAGNIMNVGFEKAFLLQNNLNLDTSEIIATYTYKMGLASAASDFSYASAIGFFNSVVNMILILIVNYIAKKLGEISLW